MAERGVHKKNNGVQSMPGYPIKDTNVDNIMQNYRECLTIKFLLNSIEYKPRTWYYKHIVFIFLLHTIILQWLGSSVVDCSPVVRIQTRFNNISLDEKFTQPPFFCWDPSTVMTLQNKRPKKVTRLHLITLVCHLIFAHKVCMLILCTRG